MAWTTLKGAIDAIFTSNGQNQITGQQTRTIVKQIVDELGSLQFKGKATPSTDPGAYDGERMYITTEAGTYTNFANITVLAGKLTVLQNSGTGWTKVEFDLPSGTGGTGDMLQSTYDTNADGKVNAADTADSVSGAATANQYYGTNGTGTKGFYNLPAGGGSGNMNTSTYDTNTNGIVDSAEKVEGVDSAGNSKYYGTNGAGAAGFHDLPASGVSSGQYSQLYNYFSNHTDLADETYVPYYYNVEDDYLLQGTFIQVVSVSGNIITVNRDFAGQDFAAINGHKWTIYKNSITPVATIDSYDPSTGQFVVSMISGAFAVNDNVSFFNPFATYQTEGNPVDHDYVSLTGLQRGATLDGKTINYPTPAQILKVKNEFVFITMVLFTDGSRAMYKSTSSDFVNWTTPVSWMTDANFPSLTGITSIQAISIVDYSGSVANAKYFGAVSILQNTIRRGGYIFLDENLNPLSDHGILPMLPGDNDESVQHYNHVITLYENRLFMTAWERIGGSDSSPQVIYEFYQKTGTTSVPTIDDIVAGNADYTKTVLSTGDAGQVGILGGHSDQATPFIYKGKLYCAISGTSDQTWCIGNANRQYTLAKYDKGQWLVTGRPFIMNPVEWGSINSKYLWSRDHMGGRFQIAEIDNRLVVCATMNNGTDSYEIFVGSISNKTEIDKKKSYNPSGIGVGLSTQFTGTDGNLYFKSGSGVVTQIN